MGFAHSGATAPEAADVAGALPRLPDRVVLETVRLGEAYSEVRSALLALSGVALMHHLGMGDEVSLAGVAATADDCLERARASLGPSLGSSSDPVCRRAAGLARISTLLQDEVTKLQVHLTREPDHRVLRAAARALSEVSAPAVGIRYLTSSSCTEAVSARRIHHHDHDHATDHADGHVHPHDHSEASTKRGMNR